MLEWMIQNLVWVIVGAVLLLIGIKIAIYRLLKRLMAGSKQT